MPTSSATGLDRPDSCRGSRCDPVDEPGRRPGRRRAEVRSQGLTGVVDPAGPVGRPPLRHGSNRRRIGDLAGRAVEDEVELVHREADGASRVMGQVLRLAGFVAGLEPEGAVDPDRSDPVDMRAPVRVDRGQPAGMTVGAAGLGAWVTPCSSRASMWAQSMSGSW